MVIILVLMCNTHHTKEEAREFLKQEALNEICSVSDYSRFHDRVFCIFTKYGLQLAAKEELFFSGDEWSDPDSKESLIRKVKQFLDEHIR